MVKSIGEYDGGELKNSPIKAAVVGGIYRMVSVGLSCPDTDHPGATRNTGYQSSDRSSSG